MKGFMCLYMLVEYFSIWTDVGCDKILGFRHLEWTIYITTTVLLFI